MTSKKFAAMPRLAIVFGLAVVGLGACSGNTNLGHDDSNNVGGATANVGGSTGNVGGATAHVGGASANVGGHVALTGGANALGGATANLGGSVAQTGGVYSIGGASANVGGAVVLTGGAPANGGASANVGGRLATGGSTSCPPECLRPINCVAVCGGTVLSSGCCACGAGTFDNVSCTSGTGGAGGALGTNTGGSTGTACGTAVCGSGQYCCNASCNMCTPIGSGCVTMECGTGGSTGAGGSSNVGGNKATGGSTSAGNCGNLTCNPSTEYCHETTGGAVGNPNTYSCVPLPSSCGSSINCTCVSGTVCGANCTQSTSGLLTTICLVPGGAGGATSSGGATGNGGATSTSDLAQSCQDSGGTVTTSQCCTSLTSDFPNNCMVGACGCSPQNSKTVNVCRCPTNMCFDGQSCVAG